MTVVEEVLAAELPGELVTGFTAGLGTAGSPVTLIPAWLAMELPALGTCTGLLWAFTGRVTTAYRGEEEDYEQITPVGTV